MCVCAEGFCVGFGQFSYLGHSSHKMLIHMQDKELHLLKKITRFVAQIFTENENNIYPKILYSFHWTDQVLYTVG